MINLNDYNIKLHLIRHGMYTPTKVGGWTDDYLNKEGKKEIKSLLDKIDNDYDLFISSDLNRAKQSSEIINKKLNMNIIYNENLREIDCGIFNNMSIEEFTNNYPKDYFSKINKFPQGESQKDFFIRIENEFNKILNDNKNKKILILTHSGVIAVILYLLGKKNVEIKTGDIIKL